MSKITENLEKNNVLDLSFQDVIWAFYLHLKAHRPISKKRCFEKYCSCDKKASQFLALQGTP